MGQATVTKKRVLGKVEDCVAAVNEVIAACTEMTEKHDALCGDLNIKFAEIESRFTAQGTWLESHVNQIAEFERAARELRIQIAKLGDQYESADQSHDHMLRFLAGKYLELERVLTGARTEAESFEALGFFGRLRWLFTGRWDRPLRHGEGIEPLVLQSPVSGTYAGIERAVETPAGAFNS